MLLKLFGEKHDKQKTIVIEIFGRLIEKLRSVYIHNGEKPLPPVPRIEHVKPNEFNVNNVIDTFNVVKDHPLQNVN